MLLTIAQYKLHAERWLQLSPDALHIHVGLFVFLIASIIGTGERRFLVAWGVVLLLALFGEILDLYFAYSRGFVLRWGNSLKDVFNTMLWPTVWVLGGPSILRMLARVRASAAVRPSRQAAAGVRESGK